MSVSMRKTESCEENVQVKDERPSESAGNQKTLFHKILHYIDAYKLNPRPPSIIGGIVTFLILPATVVYSALVYMQALSQPYDSQNELFWSISKAPFPMQIRCEVPTGCFISNSNESLKGPCSFVKHMEIAAFQFGYFHNPTLGLSVLAQSNDSEAPLISILSQAYMPGQPSSDSDWHFYHVG